MPTVGGGDGVVNDVVVVGQTTGAVVTVVTVVTVVLIGGAAALVGGGGEELGAVVAGLAATIFAFAEAGVRAVVAGVAVVAVVVGIGGGETITVLVVDEHAVFDFDPVAAKTAGAPNTAPVSTTNSRPAQRVVTTRTTTGRR